MTVLCIASKGDSPTSTPEQMAFIARFSQGCDGRIVGSLGPDGAYESEAHHEWCIRGAKFRLAVQEAWRQGRTFYYIDNGYMGNFKKKVWFRIIKNNVHDIRPIIDRPSDRLERCNVKPDARTKGGNAILVAPPSAKSFLMWDMDQQQWIDETVAKIKEVTDRPVKLREKLKRDVREKVNPLKEDLRDVHCVVTYNSVIAVESVIMGTPAITVGPNAATHVCSNNLQEIENPMFPDDDLRMAWMKHLSYSQFTFDEMSNGVAYRILNDQS